MSQKTSAPDSTAVRTALWRALHTEVDAPPHVLDDRIGLQLAEPDPDWRQRPDMNPDGTRAFRASIVARARYLDDLVIDRAAAGIRQYVILGAGLDTFAQRHRDIVVRIFEVDQPGTQDWKRRRLTEIGYPPGENLQFVPVDFERGDTFPDALRANGFDAHHPAVLSSMGVSMYLTREATETTLRQVAAMAGGSVLVMTFMLPVDLVDAAERPMQESVEAAAAASGTPFLSHYAPEEMVELCCAAGFSVVEHVGPDALAAHYFAGRTDGLRPPSAEQLIVATV
ncbi:methyltransferase, putative, TIGR00027 family [Mycobacterium sp. JS623]|uniref:class I SAM-dependent methyltransferase n=1 Tax=Mycobacterium sp. JS623 TaxID=212767 RepID=UPI0002A58EA5|nr:class I SAM-dependent methyltransferase [Mycobacterium sp. JS623]AGB22531.1 methyltransferase, putative, TIGR00027 family [Mycobacterium sp. JS623]